MSVVTFLRPGWELAEGIPKNILQSARQLPKQLCGPNVDSAEVEKPWQIFAVWL